MLRILSILSTVKVSATAEANKRLEKAMSTSHKESSRPLISKTTQVSWRKRWFFNKAPYCVRQGTIPQLLSTAILGLRLHSSRAAPPTRAPPQPAAHAHPAALSIRPFLTLESPRTAAHHSSQPRAARLHSPAETGTARLLRPQQPRSRGPRAEPQPPLTFTSGTIPFSLVAAASYSGARRLQCPHLGGGGGGGGASGPPERLGPPRPRLRPRPDPAAPALPAAPHQGAKNSTSTSPGRSARPLSKSASLSSTTSEAPAERARSGRSSSAAGGGRGTDMAGGRAELRSLLGGDGG